MLLLTQTKNANIQQNCDAGNALRNTPLKQNNNMYFVESLVTTNNPRHLKTAVRYPAAYDLCCVCKYFDWIHYKKGKNGSSFLMEEPTTTNIDTGRTQIGCDTKTT